MLNRMDSDNFEIRSNNIKLSPDLRSDYIMNSRITGVEECDLLLIIGSNPKYEAPVLNSRIYKSTRKNNLKVAVIGTPNDLTYDYMHLGSSTDLLKEIANGKHPFAERFKKAKMPMILVGSGLLERKDGEVNNINSFIIMIGNIERNKENILKQFSN